MTMFPSLISKSSLAVEVAPVVPRDVVILQDPYGLSMRVLAMRKAHPNVVAVAPVSKGIAHCLPIEVPDGWLPDREDVPAHEREWFKADAMGLAAVVNHSIDADFYWFIESDVAARRERWEAFFETFRNRKEDCLCTFLLNRGQDPKFDRRWKDAPEGASKHFIMAIYRLSRAMVERAIGMAPEMRNTFSEIAVPWVVESGGGSFGRLTSGGHFNRTTMGTLPKDIRVSPSLICHPVKSNTLHP